MNTALDQASATTATEILEALLHDHRLSSQYLDWRQQALIEDRNSWFRELQATTDPATAHVALVTWEDDHQPAAFSGLLESVAEGMLALSRLDGPDHNGAIRLVDVGGDTRFPLHSRLRRGRALVYMNDRQPYDCTCDRPYDWETYRPGGRLDLRAIVLSYDHRTQEAAHLSLVLPVRNAPDIEQARWDSGMVVLSIARNGLSGASVIVPRKLCPNLLEKMLGLVPGRVADLDVINQGHLDDLIGIPWAAKTLAVRLYGLKAYLSGLATLLAPGHHGSH